MRSLRFLLSVSFLGFAASLVQADGAKKKSVELPAPQPSVVVTVERGVRVWRPLGTDAGGGYYPQSVSANSGSEPQVQYVTPNSYGGYGVTGSYGGFGGFGFARRYERRNGAGLGFGSKHVNLNIKGLPSRHHGPKMSGYGGRHQGGVKNGGGPKHMAFVGKGGGAKPRGVSHGRGHGHH